MITLVCMFILIILKDITLYIIAVAIGEQITFINLNFACSCRPSVVCASAALSVSVQISSSKSMYSWQ